MPAEQVAPTRLNAGEALAAAGAQTAGNEGLERLY